ncbi:insulin-like growth factor 3 [Thalassophryne amazonica]|uniref:insulin-like growth factor 3 n=1 Tax=Thalassophryne amazonica TaxID=390379 RepID=UPI0014725FBE|nr:insulin-like growth factor 3 [Thalassophryne amazonica]
MFVCGDRGIYLGRGSWSGYGARPRGKGIVDQCCRPGGCDLQHLEKYCAKPKNHRQQQTGAPPTTAPTDTVEQFKAVFQRRLLEQLGAPNSPQRDAYRSWSPASLPRNSKASSGCRRTSTRRPDTASGTAATPPAVATPPAA